jgi:hypothetical protein
MSKLIKPVKEELLLSNKLRRKVLQKVRENNLSEKQVADKLGLLPSGAGALLDTKEWPIHIAIRVAAAFYIKI